MGSASFAHCACPGIVSQQAGDEALALALAREEEAELNAANTAVATQISNQANVPFVPPHPPSSAPRLGSGSAGPDELLSLLLLRQSAAAEAEALRRDISTHGGSSQSHVSLEALAALVSDDGNAGGSVTNARPSGCQRRSPASQPIVIRPASGLRAVGVSSPLRMGPIGFDVDRMSYEELLALCEFLGPAHPTSLTREQVDALPTRSASNFDCQKDRAGSSSDGMTENRCAVCYETYALGEEIRTLPCLHKFHSRCIDKWLTGDMPGARKCPICHASVR